MANMENGSGNGLDIDKIVSFCKKNVKYISGGVLLVALIIVLAVMGVNNAGGKDKPEQKAATEQEEQGNQDNDTAGDLADGEDGQTDNQEEEADANPEITELISTYYNSYASGDLDKLSGIAQKLSDMEKDYIKMMNEHVESYGNVSCTVADGVKEGSHIVAAVYQMKLAGVDETLPGMNIFYVQTDKKGGLYINNLYSSFNRELKEQKTKKKVIKLIEEFENGDVVKKLQEDVQSEYDKKVAANEDLQKKLNEMVDAIANWKETYTPPAEEEKPQEADDANADDSSADDGNADDGSADDGNADDGSADDGNADDGSSDDGNADDGNADDGSSDDGGGSGLNYVPEGTVLTANDGYNVRKSMDESSELVGTTAVGDSITIVLSYAEGWTKVEWNGTTGYIRTDLLLNN